MVKETIFWKAPEVVVLSARASLYSAASHASVRKAIRRAERHWLAPAPDPLEVPLNVKVRLDKGSVLRNTVVAGVHGACDWE